jgi:predicted small lipoprotein YifL
MMRAAIVTLAALSVVVALASCGKQADLERPGPMWGARAKADYAAQKRAQADNASNAAASNKVIGNQNPATQPYTDPGPIQQNPIPGEPTLPSGAPNPAGGTPPQ